ncbi:MAG: discoidin domain-containing protein [Jiangellaceae bacterium]
MFDSSAVPGRPAGTVVAAVLGGCAFAGFVVGALVGTSIGGADDPGQVPVAGDAPWDGEVTPVVATVAEASCEARASRDAAGRPVTYEPALSVDSDPETAWRCTGDGVGETLVLDLGGSVRVAEVALVPGYAKTDAADGTDRYAENRRLTSVRWRFDDGTTVEQELDPDPALRDLQSVRLMPRATQRLVLEIVSSSDGTRDTVAVSDVRISSPA